MDIKTYNEDLRKVWRPNWLTSINELTSLNLQKKSWLDPKAASPHWTYVEFMCSYFDGLAVDNNYEDPLERGLISQKEYEILKEWHERLDNYKEPNNDCYDVQSILEDPKWLDIIEIGLYAKNKLGQILNKEETQILFEEIDHKIY